MTKRLVSLILVLAVALSIVAVSTAQKKDSDKVTLTGNIIDKACATGRMKKDDAQASIDAHKKSCSLMENCLKSGLGVYADGKYTEFDEKGTAMAKAALEKSTKDNGAKFKVTGKMMDGKLAVASIDEVH
ncbi:MAG: hypothetical protein JNK38_13905 [Acidobacteria bacterium]|nr:hypothetical protein [Acidobacteriota bacterium]